MSSVFDQPVRSKVHGAARAHARVPRRALHLKERAVWPVAVPSSDQARRTGSRMLNVAIALVALIVLSPLMALIALLVKLTSRGPAIYTQTRVGIDRRIPSINETDQRRQFDYGGRLFRIYKFRTMEARPDSNVQIWADPNDKRITSLGRWLRKYRLDELPQLFNVLKGDMNVVGPRPEQPNIFVDLRGQIQGYSHRQQVLPGITGLAQVNQQYDRCIDDVRRKLSYDLAYVEQQAPLTDLRILVRTIPVVLFKRGGW